MSSFFDKSSIAKALLLWRSGYSLYAACDLAGITVEEFLIAIGWKTLTEVECEEIERIRREEKERKEREAFEVELMEDREDI